MPYTSLSHVVHPPIQEGQGLIFPTTCTSSTCVNRYLISMFTGPWMWLNGSSWAPIASVMHVGSFIKERRKHFVCCWGKNRSWTSINEWTSECYHASMYCFVCVHILYICHNIHSNLFLYRYVSSYEHCYMLLNCVDVFVWIGMSCLFYGCISSRRGRARPTGRRVGQLGGSGG